MSQDRVFKARYRGRCARCGGVVNIGDEIRWNRAKRGMVYHSTCPDNPEREQERKPPTAPVAPASHDDGHTYSEETQAPEGHDHEQYNTEGPQQAPLDHGKNGDPDDLCECGHFRSDHQWSSDAFPNGGCFHRTSDNRFCSCTYWRPQNPQPNRNQQEQDLPCRRCGHSRTWHTGGTGPCQVCDAEERCECIKYEEPPKQTQQQQQSPPPEDDPMAALARALAPYLEKLGIGSNGTNPELLQMLFKEVEKAHNQNAKQDAALTGHARALEDVLARTNTEDMRELHLTLTRPDGTQKHIKGEHGSMPRLLYLISKRLHVYLWGPPGGGKSTAASHAAQALGLRFGYLSLNPQTPESRLLGYKDAMGNYQATPFYELYKDGGVFCIDEMDNAHPALLTTINSMLENGLGAFPCGIVERHPDFILVSTGNTAGRGGDLHFPERRAFDVAFAERFAFLYWDYDARLERHLTLKTNKDAGPWLLWVKRVRTHCKKHHPRVHVTPRASIRGAALLADSGWTPREVAESVLFKGLASETVNKILGACPLPTVDKDEPAPEEIQLEETDSDADAHMVVVEAEAE